MASEEDLMKQMMGFSGFGASKPQSDFQSITNRKLEEAKRKDAYKKPDKTSLQQKHYGSKIDGINKDDEDEDDDDEIIGPLPPGVTLGSISKPIESSASEKEQKKDKTRNEKEDDVDDADDDDENDESDVDEEPTAVEKIPSSHEITLKHGQKVISALALDPSGSRLASGGYNYEIKFWDFNSMDINLRAFRTLEPVESHWIHSLQYSNTGDMLLIGAGNAQPQVLDRDGHKIYECKKGDQYIVDMKNTKGHVSMVRNCCWDPRDKNNFISCGDDGTVRIWDINTVRKNKEVIRLRNTQARKTGCTYCTFGHDGKLILAAGQDGSIQGWDTKRMFVNTSIKNHKAHQNGTETSCLCLAHDGRTLISRGMDDTIKQWDLRNFQKPIATTRDLVTYYATTNCCFSPDEKLIVTGTSVKKGQGAGKLLFLERDTLEPVYEIKFDDISVVSTLWHPKLNQVMIGLSDGNVKVYFDPSKSRNGATLCVGKVKRKRVDLGEELIKPQILNPHALRMYREKRTDSIKKVKAKMRADPVASHKPDAPIGTGHGVGGRLKEGMSLTGFVVRNIALAKKDTENPRDAILKHAKQAEEDPYWVTPAYSKSQPVKIFKEESDSEDDEDDDGPLGKKKRKE